MWLVVCIAPFPPNVLSAQSLTPFDTYNQSPVIQIHGIPAIDSARVLLKDKRRYRLTTNIINNYTNRQKINETVLFDGETRRVTFSYRQGMGKDVEWGVTVPYISHDGGSFDSLIEGWHDLFGLPQGGRDRNPRNKLTYRYERNGRALVNVSSFKEGLGDVRIHGAWQWSGSKKRTEPDITLRTMLSLPTGDSSHLFGNGGFDAAFWVSADSDTSLFTFPGNVWGGVGVLLTGDGDVLPKQQREAVLFGSIGAGAQTWSKVSLKAQVDIHSSLYDDSELNQINSISAQLILGGDITINKTTKLDLAVKEDPTVHASPDVVFHIGLTINN